MFLSPTLDIFECFLQAHDSITRFHKHSQLTQGGDSNVISCAFHITPNYTGISNERFARSHRENMRTQGRESRITGFACLLGKGFVAIRTQSVSGCIRTGIGIRPNRVAQFGRFRTCLYRAGEHGNRDSFFIVQPEPELSAAGGAVTGHRRTDISFQQARCITVSMLNRC